MTAALARALTSGGTAALMVLLSACGGTESGSGAPTTRLSATTSSTGPAVAIPSNEFERLVGTVDGFQGSVLVAKGDTVLLSKGFGLADQARGVPNTPTTRYRIASLSKQFTAAAILVLADRRKLRVDDPVCEHLASCPRPWRTITVEQLLSHTAGLPSDGDIVGSGAVTPAQHVAVAQSLPLAAPPGSRFEYSNIGYIVLTEVIQRVSGASYDAFLRRAIFQPLGMRDSGYDTGKAALAVGYASGTTVADPIDMRIPAGSGGLYSTVEDLRRWARGLMSGAVLRPAAFEAMTTPRADMGMGADYGYGLVVRRDPGVRVVEHNGQIKGFASQLTMHLTGEVTVVILCNREDERSGEYLASQLVDRALAQ